MPPCPPILTLVWGPHWMRRRIRDQGAPGEFRCPRVGTEAWVPVLVASCAEAGLWVQLPFNLWTLSCC